MKNVNENHRHITWKGGRGESVSTETRKTGAAPQPCRGGRGEIRSPRKENTRSHTDLCRSRSSQNTQIALASDRGRGQQDEKEKNTKTGCPVPMRHLITQTTAGTERGV